MIFFKKHWLVSTSILLFSLVIITCWRFYNNIPVKINFNQPASGNYSFYYDMGKGFSKTPTRIIPIKEESKLKIFLPCGVKDIKFQTKNKTQIEYIKIGGTYLHEYNNSTIANAITERQNKIIKLAILLSLFVLFLPYLLNKYLYFITKKIANHINNLSYAHRWFYSSILVFIVIAGLVYLRAPHAFTYKLLWAEDATYSYNQAYFLGFKSFFYPIAKYIIIMQRIYALLALPFSDYRIPHVYLFFVIFNFTIVFMLLAKFFSYLGKYRATFIGLLLLLVPAHPAMFSNLTFIQWPLSILLTVLFVQDWNFISKIKKALFSFAIIILGLTGPYSLIFSPLCLFRIFIKKDFKRNVLIYFVYFLTAIIELLPVVFLRLAHKHIGIEQVILSFKYFFTSTLPELSKYHFISIIFIIWLIYLLYKAFKKYNFKLSQIINDKSILACFMLIIAGSIITISGRIEELSQPIQLQLWHPYIRYTYNLYFGILATALILSTTKKQIIVSSFLISVISLTTFWSEKLPNIYWDSHVALAKKVKGVIIEVNPYGTFYFAKLRSKITQEAKPDKKITLNFNAGDICPESTDIGFIIDTDSKIKAKNLSLYSQNKVLVKELFPHYKKNNKYRYYYAMPISDNYESFYFDNPNKYKINVYCLKR